MSESNSLKYLDLFSGAGGLSEGFLEQGFSPVAHVEIDVHSCQTLETRLVYHSLAKKGIEDHYVQYLEGNISRSEYISTYSNTNIDQSIINLEIGKDNKKIFKKIDDILDKDNIDVIVGGPPCQAYSLIGRSRDANNMKNDSRNYLYKEYAKFLKKYKPKIFVFENVLGLITANKGRYFLNMQGYFRSIGYELDYTIQKSEDFGVLQKRRRIILIGWINNLDFTYPNFVKVENNFTTKDLFSDLKYLRAGEENNITYYEQEPSEYLSSFKLRNESTFVTQHVARPHNDRDLEIYKIAVNKWLDKRERLKYPDLPTRLKTHRNEKSFMDRFKVVDINGLSHTMVAHIAKDGHYYIYPSKEQTRSLSVREAARIQSFPDDYYFEGGRTSAFKQIGNAVPPLMSKEIAKSIKELLCQS